MREGEKEGERKILCSYLSVFECMRCVLVGLRLQMRVRVRVRVPVRVRVFVFSIETILL